MKTFKLHVFLLFLMLTVIGFSQSVSHKFLKSKYLQTGVHFESNDTLLKKLFDVAEAKALKNIRYFTPEYTVMVEGGEYPFVWLETQPMGGVMYAKRDLNV